MIKDQLNVLINLAASDRIIDDLIALKRKYPGVINMLDSTLDLMRSKNSRSVTDNCLFKDKAYTLGADGKPKGKCMMGDNADCDRCGCVVPFHMATLSSRRLMLKEAIKSGQRALPTIQQARLRMHYGIRLLSSCLGRPSP